VNEKWICVDVSLARTKLRHSRTEHLQEGLPRNRVLGAVGNQHEDTHVILSVWGMFNFFKSTEALEKSLRQWLVDEEVFRHGDSARRFGEEYVGALDIKRVVEHVLVIACSKMQDEKFLRSVSGPSLSTRESAFFLKGIKLVKDLAKRKGWKVTMNANECVISEIEMEGGH
jgi:hypothetical protein